MPSYVPKVVIALRGRAFGRVAGHGIRAWRDDNGRFGMALGNTGVDSILVV